MNTIHPNIAVLSQFDPNNTAGPLEILSEDAVLHFFNPKLPDVQGDYIGPKGFQDFFKKMAGFSGGSFKVHPISITPMGDELVVTHVKDTMVLNGQRMELDAVVVWRIVDGKITEAWDIPAIHTAKVSNPDADKSPI
ncbi:nuclear transport factor 2 family protein [Muricauda sp. JGD-17]|uniref:Nuclear transport factor 2 family protein n=1 Tax=Flagellimonas ochracea TaxID=2696472 RepID=A0A964WX89_9FLAO|nr:nuclear transport factor 2 family protein [Allomuricauda ochracea]NAY91344.1 nuclear transport factor 2 family protein [Allomuricauda ochracea]